MSYKWLIITGLVIGALLFCLTFRVMEWADNKSDSMTAYEQLLKNPTAAGK
jgi:hypothetical protein